MLYKVDIVPKSKVYVKDSEDKQDEVPENVNVKDTEDN